MSDLQRKNQEMIATMENIMTAEIKKVVPTTGTGSQALSPIKGASD